jgi:hypothetical protein
MALPIRSAIRSMSRFVVQNPLSLVRMAVHAANLRVAIPLDTLRWLIANTPPGKKATDIVITARPPAIHVGATVELMKTRLRASGAVRVEELRIDSDEMRLSLRLSDVDMRVLDGAATPIAGLIKSGALDLSKPGNLVNFIPKRPAALVDAHDDIVVIDLMKIPKLAKNLRVRQVLERLTPVIHVSALKTEGDFLILALRATPLGVPRALSPARF